MTLKYIPVFLVAALPAFFLAFAGDKSGRNDFELAKELIAIRMIGHEILLHAGDSTSRILPVKKITENEYQLQFENRFAFEPDSLVGIIQRVITANHLSPDYIVNVINCSGREIVYGYAIFKSEQNNIVPCTGRKQPPNCYYITIQFSSPGRAGFQKTYFIVGIGLLALGLCWWGLQLYHKRKEAAPLKDKPVQIGKFLFYHEGQYLSIDEEKTPLTMKEAALLSVFAAAPNQIIERSRLQKEIWEDEGVIVGRSLDMFVSKLRKKLENDPAVRLINIHGIGYKLEVNPGND